jgi:hypothetical protein
MTTGTIVAGAVIAAGVIAAIVASNGGDGTTPTHTTTPAHH